MLRTNPCTYGFGKAITVCFVSLIVVTALSDRARALTFGPVQILSSESESISHPSIAVGGMNIHVVWTEFRSGIGSSLLYRRSTDGGISFNPTQNLATDAFSNPLVAAEGSHVFIVWWDGTDVFFLHSADRGATFGPLVKLTAGTGDRDPLHGLVINGSVVVVTILEEGNLFLHRSVDSGVTFEPRFNLSNTPSPLTVTFSLSPLAVSGSTVAVVWIEEESCSLPPPDECPQRGTIFYRSSIDGGSTFGPIQNLSGIPLGDPAVRVLAGGGVVFVEWSASTSDGVRQGGYQVSTDGGLTLGPLQAPSGKSIKAIDGCVFHGSGASDDRPVYQRSTDCGTTFEPDQPLSEVITSGGGFPPLAVHGPTVGVLWRQVTSSQPLARDIFFAGSTDGGSSFGAAQNISESSGDSILAPFGFGGVRQLVVTDAIIGVVWIDSTPGTGEVFFRRAVTPSLDPRPLVAALKTLRRAVLNKIEVDIDTTTTAFGDAKDLQRSLFWFDWAEALFDIVTGTIKAVFDLLSLFGANLVEFNQKIVEGINGATGFVQTASWISTIQGLWDDGVNLQLSIDGPTYTSLVEDMITQAEKQACRFSCVIRFKKDKYEKAIENSLRNSNKSPLVVPHRTTDVRRTKFEVRHGINQVKQEISNKIQGLIHTLSTLPALPNDFPLSDTLLTLQILTTKIKESRSRGVDVVYSTLLANEGELVTHNQNVRLGGLGSWEQVRAAALTEFDHNALFEQLITVNTSLSTVLKAVTLHVGITYQVLGQVQVPVSVASILTTGIDIGLSNLKSDSIKARDLVNQIPQNMIMEFPEELSKVWMIIDDVVNTIQLRLGL